MILVKDGDVDIGANPSAEEAEEAMADGAEQVNNVVHSMRLQPSSFDKKPELISRHATSFLKLTSQSYLAYLKGYMKAVKAHLQEKNPERVEAFEKNAQTFAKKIIGNFKDYEFYVGESMNPDGMVALLNYREDGTTPYVSTSPT
ncbi:translationally-controlled tumor protein [Trichosporon asahii var. asahii CBS 2479]|uniref:Translationally-controlled tumor protein homolog n=1 Tax=Trichosporon asahii var. asahii (strain ATCC 90039 / CBS 2479 / JCM 2466 / KCTC 7840 / NBRC 103889/ NCYC 2677 / UAMH 7654) TaxID=1186058 RepID=J4U990_TRIAS|nr:translationally-controlled tumor protein [Trichosporon asahii var. asahii CBS 2479]EJT47180.1 translationally-controlled tumor protein [Trichosporon asahii var. asahii CBS 2479]